MKWMNKKVLGFTLGAVFLVVAVGLYLFRDRPQVSSLVNKGPSL